MSRNVRSVTARFLPQVQSFCAPSEELIVSAQGTTVVNAAVVRSNRLLSGFLTLLFFLHTRGRIRAMSERDIALLYALALRLEQEEPRL